MPHSDNLYSADDSDPESFSDELSPRDGYFNPTRMPADRMVQDPSLDTKEVEPKTLVPTPNPQSRTGGTSRSSLHSILPPSNTSRSYASPYSGSNQSFSPSSYTPMSPVSSSRREPAVRRSLSMSGPPPAYSPPQSPMTPVAPHIATYSTFPDQYVERSFLPEREPESMGGPVEEPSETTPLAQQSPTESPYQRFRTFFHGGDHKRKVIKHFLLAALIFTIISTLLTMMSGHSTTDLDTNPDVDPITGMPLLPSGSYCARATHHLEPISYEFPTGDALTVIQSLQSDDWHEGYVKIDTVGQIIVRRLTKDHKNADKGQITVDIWVSDPDLPIIKTWDAQSRAYEIKTPRFARLPSSVRHCISVEITAWIPEDAEFTNLKIESVTLALTVLNDIKINVKESSYFETITGKIRFPRLDLPSRSSESSAVQEASASPFAVQESTHPFSSRWIQIRTVSSSISGTYPLRDYLGISSQSGTITVLIDPQKVLPDSPSPATLDIYTTSGTITANLPITSSYTPPPRNYITQVRTQSGTISGSYYLGSSTVFTSTSSTIKLTLLPILEINAKERSNPFETSSVSGTTNIKIVEPIFLTLQEQKQPIDYTPIHDKDPYLLLPPMSFGPSLYAISTLPQYSNTKISKLRSLDSKHSTTSGSITAHYPISWEGVLKANTISASIKASGEGLIVVRDKKGFVNRELWAFKGVEGEEEGGNVAIKSVSGSIKFSVDDE